MDDSIKFLSVNGRELVAFDRGNAQILNLDSLQWRDGPVNNELSHEGQVLHDGDSFLAISGRKMVSK